MSKDKMKELLQLAVAAVRAYYGDYTAAAGQAVKYLPKILTFICVLLLIIIFIPLAIVQSLFTGWGDEKKNNNIEFQTIVSECMEFKEDWLEVLAVVQTKKVLSNDEIDINGASEAVKGDRVEEYLANGTESNGISDIMDIYNKNYSLLNDSIGGYVGRIYYYDEAKEPYSYDSIYKKYNADTGKTELWAKEKVEIINTPKPTPTVGPSVTPLPTPTPIIRYETNRWKVYSKNHVAAYKVDDGKVKIKHPGFGFKAYFPIPAKHNYSYTDDFGAQRFNNGENESHQGIDIFAKRNTPVIAIEDCSIKKIGWNGLGGWRILFESIDGSRQYYYAHMEGYSQKLKKYMDMTGRVYERPGINVQAGEVVGYIGSSGSFKSNLPPGSDTGTSPHLHIQVWIKSSGWLNNEKTLINPYYSLKMLEMSKYDDDRKYHDKKLKEAGLSD